MVSGDFDHDGNIDDIAVFYDYGWGNTTMHVFESNESSFDYSRPSGWGYGYLYIAPTVASTMNGRIEEYFFLEIYNQNKISIK